MSINGGDTLDVVAIGLPGVPEQRQLHFSWRTSARVFFAIALALYLLPFIARAGVLPEYDRVRILADAVAIPDAKLTDQNGETLQLQDLRGRVALVFFGFTHCPDVCPLAMQRMRMLEESGTVPGDAVAYVLISVDGERDSPKVLKSYLEQYSPNFIGLTAPPGQVKRISKQFSAVFYKGAVNEADGGYSVSHSPQIFVVDPDGKARAEFYNPDVEAMAAVVNALLDE